MTVVTISFMFYKDVMVKIMIIMNDSDRLNCLLQKRIPCPYCDVTSYVFQAIFLNCVLKHNINCWSCKKVKRIIAVILLLVSCFLLLIDAVLVVLKNFHAMMIITEIHSCFCSSSLRATQKTIATPNN